MILVYMGFSICWERWPCNKYIITHFNHSMRAKKPGYSTLPGGLDKVFFRHRYLSLENFYTSLTYSLILETFLECLISIGH